MYHTCGKTYSVVKVRTCNKGNVVTFNVSVIYIYRYFFNQIIAHTILCFFKTVVVNRHTYLFHI